MGNSILVISHTETFTIKGLEMKIKNEGISTFFCVPKVKDLEGKIDAADLVILYMDGSASDIKDALIYIKDVIMEKNKQVILIGEKLDYPGYEKMLGVVNILNFYERPLQIEKLLEELDAYFTEASAEARRKCVLIIDDDVHYMNMISDWLKDKYRIAKANSGMNAITWLATNHADLILLDYEMPITTGPQVLQMIKSEAKTATIPVMFLTGNADKESIMQVLALKPVDYLLKSINKNGLREKIDSFFINQAMKS
ncbi:MAG: response regulator [Lachnospiraceae bacterium]|nr:response regulator [Lachnospiraceae bacterium]